MTSARQSPSIRWTWAASTTPDRTRASCHSQPATQSRRLIEEGIGRVAMRNGKLLRGAIGTLFAFAATLAAHDARSGGPPRQATPNSSGHGFASVYGDVPADQAEF